LKNEVSAQLIVQVSHPRNVVCRNACRSERFCKATNKLSFKIRFWLRGNGAFEEEAPFIPDPLLLLLLLLMLAYPTAGCPIAACPIAACPTAACPTAACPKAASLIAASLIAASLTASTYLGNCVCCYFAEEIEKSTKFLTITSSPAATNFLHQDQLICGCRVIANFSQPRQTRSHFGNFFLPPLPRFPVQVIHCLDVD
jgi:hypothetical protein